MASPHEFINEFERVTSNELIECMRDHDELPVGDIVVRKIGSTWFISHKSKTHDTLLVEKDPQRVKLLVYSLELMNRYTV